jgi:cytochrome c-type biogenesis protein CcmH/NrfG
MEQNVMAIDAAPALVSLPRSLPGKHVFLIAAMCLVAGLAAGFLTRGLRVPARAVVKTNPHAASGGHMLSLAEMKQIADQQAAPLLEKLKTDPNNVALLAQVGTLYHTTHQFAQAAAYYQRAVNASPKDVALRTKLAASLYRGGDADAALGVLAQAQAIDGNDANTLFNIGMIKWQGKGDARGALAAWQRLLKTNPQLSAERRATVQQLMAEAQATLTRPLHKRGMGR